MLTGSTLWRWEQNNFFLFRVVRSEVRVEWEIFSQYLRKRIIWLVTCLTNGIWEVFVTETLLFCMTTTVSLCLAPIRCYSQSNTIRWFLAHSVDQICHLETAMGKALGVQTKESNYGNAVLRYETFCCSFYFPI